jgi:hypothetical protein
VAADDVEDDPVVGRVGSVVVRPPAAREDVDLDVPHDEAVPRGEDGVEEIRAVIVVAAAGHEDGHGTVRGDETVAVSHAAGPVLDDPLFRKDVHPSLLLCPAGLDLTRYSEGVSDCIGRDRRIPGPGAVVVPASPTEVLRPPRADSE